MNSLRVISLKCNLHTINNAIGGIATNCNVWKCILSLCEGFCNIALSALCIYLHTIKCKTSLQKYQLKNDALPVLVLYQ